MGAAHLIIVVLASALLFNAHQCCAALPMSSHHQPKAFPRLHHGRRNRSLFERSLLFAVRGGESSDESLQISNDNEPTIQQQSLLGAPLQAVLLSVSGIGKMFLREVQSLTIRQRLLFVATLAFGFCMGRLWPFWKRYTNVLEIPPHRFGGGSKKPGTLWGRAVTISDGDTIRFLHQPTPFHPKRLRKGEKSSAVALPVRICTIDAPETAKFGNSGQPFGQEAKKHLEALLVGKRVGIRLLRKDQYSRVVAEVFTSGRIPLPFFRTYVDEHMLQEGLAELYTGGGAVYGSKGIRFYETLQAQAKKSKKGIWSLKRRESAAEYKKRNKEELR